MTPNRKDERLHHIDWIRVLAFLLLICFHSALPFTIFPWEVKNKEQSVQLSSIIWWFHQWRLPLLFFISGAGIHFSLKRRSVGAFLGERFVRLFIPLLFAMFFTIPLQVYFEFMQRGRFKGSYVDFYPSVWELTPYPDGSLTWSHMWFVVYLIAFILLLIPLWLIAKTKWGSRLKERISNFLTNPLVTSLLVLPLMLIFHRLYLSFPETGGLIGDWFVMAFSVTMLLYGYFLGGRSDFWLHCMGNLRWHGGIAFLIIMLLFSFYWWPMRLPEKTGLSYNIYTLLNVAAIWQTILFICGMARKYLNHESRQLTYLNKAVFPFFIIHQTVIVAIGYYVTGSSLNIPLKLTLLITLSTLIIFITFHFIIRKTRLTRILFGMKSAADVKQTPHI